MAEPTRGMNRNFLLLWQGQVVSQIGTQLFLVIVVLSLKQITNSPTLVGLFMMAYTIPAVLLGPLGGALADRYSRRMVLVAGDLIRGLILIGIALALWRSPHSVHIIVVSFFIYSVVDGTVGAIWLPASMSVLPDLVPAGASPERELDHPRVFSGMYSCGASTRGHSVPGFRHSAAYADRWLELLVCSP